MKTPDIFLPMNLKPRLSHGHPWVYANQIEAGGARPATGDWVRVRCGSFSAYGLWDAGGAIAVRLFSQKAVPGEEWLRARLAEAYALRAPIRDGQRTTAYRWVFGEADGLPGLTVDLYDQYAVVQTYSASLDTILGTVIELLPQIAPLKGILERRRATAQPDAEMTDGRDPDDTPQRVQLVWGRKPPRELVIEEHGLKFHANLFEGQKTGLFLDHRENRRYLQEWCNAKSVLNCFAYTGAFSLYAARGGARAITSCDIAADAMTEAANNFRLNGFDPDQYEFVADDCFELLDRYRQQGRSFDIVVLDPPSFAHNKKNVYNALRGYTRLNQLALGCVAPGGLLVSASCTSYVSPDMFRQMLADAAGAAGKRLLVLHDAGQPLDHPVPAHFLEGRYLKFTLSRVQAVA